MKAKANLVPDCDVHGEPMVREERPACTLGLEGHRDELFWRCSRDGCHRYFHGSLGYRHMLPLDGNGGPAVHCERDGAFLVVQKASGSYVCPVAGCRSSQDWHMPGGETKAGKPRQVARA